MIEKYMILFSNSEFRIFSPSVSTMKMETKFFSSCTIMLQTPIPIYVAWETSFETFAAHDRMTEENCADVNPLMNTGTRVMKYRR